MRQLTNQFRQTLRRLAREPGFTATALLTLLLSMGANLTIYAVVDSVLLRPLPLTDPSRLVLMYNTYPNAGVSRNGASVTNYMERRGQIPAFAQMAELSEGTAVIGEPGATEMANIGRVSPAFFATLGTRLAMGREFTDAEMTYQSDHEAILTNAYWREHFGADPRILGQSIRSDGLTRTIVGVLPPDFRFLSSTDEVYLPLSTELSERSVEARHTGSNTLIARLAPGATLAQAQSQIDAHNAAHAAEFRFAKEVGASGFRTIVAPLHADHVASIRPTLVLLEAGAVFLLLIGAVNIINLLLIRASTRDKEFAVRRALGASQRHVVRDVLVETVTLTLAGGIGALVLGSIGVQLLATLGASQLPLGAYISVDGRVATVLLAASIALGVVIAIPIIWFNTRGHVAGMLQSAARGTAGRAVQRVRYGFVVTQVALAFALLAGAGLLGVSLSHIMAVSPGFRADHVLAGQFNLPSSAYRGDSARLAFTDRLLDALAREPGIVSTGIITDLPVSGDVPNSTALTVIGYTPGPSESIIVHPTHWITGDYFTAMGIPLRQGRYLDRADSHRPGRVCVVDEDFAKYYWPKGNAIGQRMVDHIETATDKDGGDTASYTVVGVVGRIKQVALTESHSTGVVYFPYARAFTRSLAVVVRTTLPPELVGHTLRTVVRELDPNQPVNHIQTMDARVSDSLVARRSPALLTAVFAAVALLLAAIGTYGVSSYAVAQRRREIGVRMALGARATDVLAQFLGLGAKLLAAGVVLGSIGTWIMGRAVRTILFNVGATDARILVGTTVIMAAVVLLAVFIPSRRASRVAPIEALKTD